ncbi:hypothetical protein IFM12275_50460 [Nocardia sputorum]|nr:hypothetical protein IFM12275_50460 [Nocardia sputorum]
MWTSDWHRFRRLLLRLLPPPRPRGDIGVSYPVRRELGGWTVRPSRLAPMQVGNSAATLHAVHPADHEDAAIDWALERMGM